MTNRADYTGSTALKPNLLTLIGVNLYDFLQVSLTAVINLYPVSNNFASMEGRGTGGALRFGPSELSKCIHIRCILPLSNPRGSSSPQHAPLAFPPRQTAPPRLHQPSPTSTAHPAARCRWVTRLAAAAGMGEVGEQGSGCTWQLSERCGEGNI